MTMEARIPQKGEVQIVVILGPMIFIAWASRDKVEGLMDSFEQRAKLTQDDRTSQLAQASVRVEIARLLRGDAAERHFTEVLAAGCLWLALRHWSGGEQMRKGLDKQMEDTGYAVVTASIPDVAPAGQAPDTAWAFIIGSRIHDGREQLAATEPGKLSMIGRNLQQ